MTPPSLRRSESGFDGARGERLFRRAWLPRDPQRALLVIHGMAEHSGRYEPLGAWFAERDCAVHAYDQRGHGRSGGPPGHLDRIDDYLDDLERITALVREAHPGLPLYLIGHSMGGLVLASFLRERKPNVAGAVSSGAALDLSAKLSGARLVAARLLRRLTPRLQLDSGVALDDLSRDPEVGRRYEADPLVFRKVTVSTGVELFDAARRVRAGAADVEVPVLVLHGAEDRLCPPEGSRAFHAGLKPPGSALRIYPELRHEIFNEPEAEQIFAEMLAWLHQREGNRGEADGVSPTWVPQRSSS